MRWVSCVILVALAACDGNDDFCDPSLHYLTWKAVDTQWIEYVDSDTYVVGPHPVAVGGDERYVVSEEDGCGSASAPGPLNYGDVPPTVADVAIHGATIDIGGIAPGAFSMLILDGTDTTTRFVVVRPIDSVRTVADELGVPGAFFVGIPQVKIQLMAADGQWVVDRNLSVSGPIAHGAAWNLLDTGGLGVGTYAENVLAGGSTWPISVTIVDHIDDIVADAPTPAVPYGSEEVCFFAHTNGVIVAGVPWTFDFDPDGGSVERPNCVEVWPRDNQQKSTTVTAHALGMSMTSTVMFRR